jgi:hypothetical protein
MAPVSNEPTLTWLARRLRLASDDLTLGGRLLGLHC